MRRPILSVLVLALSIAAPAHASGSSQAPEYRFRTRADGYRIVVEAYASTLFFGVIHNARARGSGTATYYVARARTRGGTISSRIGSLGTISMSFRPSGPERLEQRHCGPSLTRARPGAFVGRLRFRGEGGYVALDARRLQGVELRHGPRCDLAPADRIERSGKVDRLSAGFRAGLESTYFGAVARATEGSFFWVEADAGGSEYAVHRYAYAHAPVAPFQTDRSLSFAHLTPPYPFSGSGSLQRAADGAPLWTGNLAVSFPGDPDVPLTGPLFKVRLTRSW